MMTGSPRRPACDGMPALMLASGPIVVPSPIAMRPSPKMTVGGNAIMMPVAEARGSFARGGGAGPIAPTWTSSASHAACDDQSPANSARSRPSSTRRTVVRHVVETGIHSPPWPMACMPIRVGLLYDYPQGEQPLRGRVATRARRGRGVGSPRPRDRARRGPRARAARRQRARDRSRGSTSSIAEGVIAIVGPSISDNALIVAPLCDAARPSRDQLHRRRTHAIAVDVPLPGRVARGGAAAARGAHGRARPAARGRACSTSRRSAAATPSASKRRAPGSVSRSPAPRASRRWPRTPATC